MSGKTGFAYHLYLLLNFSRGLHDVIWLPILLHTKDALLPNNSGNHMTSQNLKWRCTGNLKCTNGHPGSWSDSVRMAIHFFVNFDIFKWLYLSYY